MQTDVNGSSLVSSEPYFSLLDMYDAQYHFEFGKASSSLSEEKEEEKIFQKFLIFIDYALIFAIIFQSEKPMCQSFVKISRVRSYGQSWIKL